jgi:hypothetical protein
MKEIQFHIIKNTIPLLEKSIGRFCDVLEKPYWSNDEAGGQPRYKSPTSGHFQLLMAVKTVSTFNAILCLFEKGYIQEIGALLRIIEECNAKILCIEEAHTKEVLNAEQKKIINEYFEYDIRSSKDIFRDKWFANMARVFASQARFLTENTTNKDSHTTQQNAQAIYDSYSGYVHGFYPQVMELYDYNISSFQLNGMADDKGMIGAISSSVVRSINVFAQISFRFGLPELKDELVKNRNIFIKSEAYSGNKEIE